MEIAFCFSFLMIAVFIFLIYLYIQDAKNPPEDISEDEYNMLLMDEEEFLMDDLDNPQDY